MSIFILTPASVREQYDMFFARTVLREGEVTKASGDFTGSTFCYAFVPKITIAFSGSQVIDSEIIAPPATACKKFLPRMILDNTSLAASHNKQQ